MPACLLALLPLFLPTASFASINLHIFSTSSASPLVVASV
jgi:hypothetical protein